MLCFVCDIFFWFLGFLCSFMSSLWLSPFSFHAFCFILKSCLFYTLFSVALLSWYSFLWLSLRAYSPGFHLPLPVRCHFLLVTPSIQFHVSYFTLSSYFLILLQQRFLVLSIKACESFCPSSPSSLIVLRLGPRLPSWFCYESWQFLKYLSSD